jgi:hypothetical protein
MHGRLAYVNLMIENCPIIERGLYNLIKLEESVVSKMLIAFSFISGFMIGIEFLLEEKGLVLDLGIIRVFFILGDNNE